MQSGLFKTFQAVGIFLASILPLIYVLRARKRLKYIWVWGPLSVLFLLAGTETALRISPWNFRFLPMSVGQNFDPHPDLLWLPGQDKEQSAKPMSKGHPPEIHFRKIPTNIEKNPGTDRIVVMGASNAWGQGIENYKDTFTGIVEQYLQKEFPDRTFEFALTAVHGYSVFQNLVLYKLMIRNYEPDIVILYANVNDRYHFNEAVARYTFREAFRMRTGVSISDLWTHEKRFPKKGSGLWNVRKQLGAFRSYNALVLWITGLRDDVLSTGENVLGFKKMNPIEDYRSNLVDLIDIVRHDGGQVVLVDAFCYPDLASPGQKNKWPPVHETMTSVAQEKNVIYVPAHQNLSRENRPDQFVFPHDLEHINYEGHEKVAGYILDALQRNGMIVDRDD